MKSYYQKGNFAIVPNMHLLPKMRGAPLSVFIVLCEFADSSGRCFPGKKIICNRTGYKIGQVKKALQELRELGIIETSERVREDGSRTSNNYRIIIVSSPEPESQNDVDVQPVTLHNNLHTPDLERDDRGGSLQRPGGGSLQRPPYITNPIRTNPLFNSPSGEVELQPIRRLYDHFIKEFAKNPNQYRLSDQRKKKLKSRCRDAGEEMVRRAITNTANSKFHRGDNDRGWEADLDFIIRSYEQVERLANRDGGGDRIPTAEEALKSLDDLPSPKENHHAI